MNKSDFDSVAWIRKIRDENYSRYKFLSMEEFAKNLVNESRKTDLWKIFHSKSKQLTNRIAPRNNKALKSS